MVETDYQRGFTHSLSHTHIKHGENDRSSCWHDPEVMLDHNTEEKNKFLNPGGCLRCELLDHMVVQGCECFLQCVYVCVCVCVCVRVRKKVKTEDELLCMCAMRF